MLSTFLLLSVFVIGGFSQCVVDELKAQECLDILRSHFDSGEDMCSIVDEVRTVYIQCEAEFSGDCGSHQIYIEMSGYNPDQFATQCADTQCYSDFTTCTRTFQQSNSLDTTCQRTSALITALETCVQNLQGCSEETKKVLEVQVGQLKQGLATKCSQGDSDCGKMIDSCLDGEQFAATVSGRCSSIQDVLNCLKESLTKCTSESRRNRIYAFIRRVRYYGCSLKIGDTSLQNVTGCNLIRALQCLHPLRELFDQTDYFSVDNAIENIEQAKLCNKVMTLDMTGIYGCADESTATCPSGQQQPPYLQSSAFTYRLDFYRSSKLNHIRAFCSPGCHDIDSKVTQINLCLTKVDINKMTRENDCNTFASLVSCVKKHISGCPILQSNWIEYLTAKQINRVASVCSRSVGTQECFARKQQDMEIRNTCLVGGRVKMDTEQEVCLAYQFFIECITSHSTSCPDLRDKHIQPHYLHLSAANEMFSCRLQYSGAPVKVQQTDACSTEHYVNCFNDLTSALGVPNLNLVKANVTTINALFNLRDYIVKNSGVCRKLERLNFNTFKSCITGIRSGCGYPTPSVQLPWAIEAETVQDIIQSTCRDDCYGVNVDLVQRECKLDVSLCQMVELDSFLSTQKSSKCSQIKDFHNCMSRRLAKCAYARDIVNNQFTNACGIASKECFGNVLKIPAYSSSVDDGNGASTAFVNSLFLLLAAGFSILTIA